LVYAVLSVLDDNNNDLVYMKWADMKLYNSLVLQGRDFISYKGEKI